MNHDDFLKRLNLTPERVAQLQELVRSLDAYDQNLKSTSAPSHELLKNGLAASASDCIDMIARVVPELPRKEVEERLKSLLHHRNLLNGSSDTSLIAICNFLTT